MLRRSSRIGSKTTDVGPQDYGQEKEIKGTESPHAPAEQHRPVKKRQRPAEKSENDQAEGLKIKRTRGRRGSLQELAEMPLDILFEILCYLKPADLLHLARTTKLRALLMTRSAEWVWRHARSNVEGMPACPKDLTEPQYAHLAFDSSCHHCSSTTRTILWSSRSRCCKQCLTSSHYLRPKETPFLRTMDGRLAIPWSYIRGHRHIREVRFRGSTVEKYEVEYNTLGKDEAKAWFAEKRQLCDFIITHAKLCETWHTTRTSERAAELEELRIRRYTSIQERLTALGFGDEFKLGRPKKLLEHKSVRQPKLLTDRVWETIKPDLIPIMEKLRGERLKEERMKILISRVGMVGKKYSQYVASQPLHAIIPKLGDILIMADFKTVLEETPLEELITDAHLAPAIASLPRLIETWRKEQDAKLVALLQKQENLENMVTETTLELATTFFKCRRCLELLGYPGVLKHGCLPCGESPLSIVAGSLPWTCEGIIFEHTLHKGTTLMLKECGYNPVTTTAKEMRNANPLFECLTCNSGPHFTGRMLLRYLGGTQHLSIHQSAIEKNDYRLAIPRLSSEDELRVATLEGNRINQRATCSANWDCVWCKKQLRWYQVAGHLREEHDIDIDTVTTPMQESENTVVLSLGAELTSIYRSYIQLLPVTVEDASI